MPIVIHEVVFKATVDASNAVQRDQPRGRPQAAVDQEELIQVCVEEVLRVLERQKER